MRKKNEKNKLIKINPHKLPKHIAIIMDGNGRWARRRGMPRVAGHREGVKTVNRIIEASVKLGIKVLTLYTFSKENWIRPKMEIDALMDLLYANLMNQKAKLLENDIQLRISGSLDNFPQKVKSALNDVIVSTASCKKLVLNLALGYSGRQEILAACRRFVQLVKDDIFNVEDLSEDLFSSLLYTSDLPDPDLLIRTSGEYRLSNFLIWQSSYAELFFTEVLWPDYTEKDLREAIYAFQKRDRRFGGIESPETKN
ncbi:isoprenyl transferase [bacterium]|nr:isoprenyl transferase [candidate division CSSED10-310 bacterium]